MGCGCKKRKTNKPGSKKSKSGGTKNKIKWSVKPKSKCVNCKN